MTKQGNTALRVGVIGVGGIGKSHLKAFAAVPEASVVAIADANPVRLAEMAAEFNVPDTYADYRALLDKANVDAVAVCTPNDLHAPVTIAALEAGKHVLCEKPLATSTAEALAMVRAAQAADRALLVAFSHRRRGDVRWLKRAVDDGLFGDIYYARAMWMRRSGIPSWGGWFTDKARAGGGPLIDLGVHMLDMALYLMGDPKVLSVTASTYAALGPRGKGFSGNRYNVQQVFDVEDLATAFIRLEGGKTLALETSWAGYGKHQDSFGVSLFGANGGAELDVAMYTEQDTVRVFTDMAGAPVEVRPTTERSGSHAAIAREFSEIILSGQWTDVIGRDGLRRAQVIEAAYQSARDCREIAVEDLAAQV